MLKNYIISLSVFTSVHLIFKYLITLPDSVFAYGLYALVNLALCIFILIFDFNKSREFPAAKYIAGLCLVGVLINCVYGIYYIPSFVTPIWMDFWAKEGYVWGADIITIVQYLLFAVGAQQNARHIGNIGRGSSYPDGDKDNHHHKRAMAK